MKNNWLGNLSGVFFVLLSPLAFSLGLGGVSTDSALNQPLIAEIELINVGNLQNTEVLVGIGTDSDYRLAGVAKEYFHSDLKFDVQVEGTDKPRILVTTKRPLQDPYVNFLVQVRWPQGKLLREYTILLDIPVFSTQSTPQPAEQTKPAAVTAREAVAQQETRQQTRPSRATPRSNTRSRPQSSRRSSGSSISGSNYQVSSGDTLWAVAGRVANQSGVSRHQAMLAIYENNADAFVDGDVNRMKAGVSLSLPSESDMSSRGRGEAFREFSSLASDAGATPVRSANNNFRQSNNEDASSQNGRLALSSNADTTQGSSVNSVDSGSSANTQAMRDALAVSQAENNILKEELDAASLEEQDLKERIANLEEQLTLTQELLDGAAIEVESDELAAAQQALTAEQDVVEEIQAAEEIEEPAEAEVSQTVEEQPDTAAIAESETFLDRIQGAMTWILIGLGLLVVIVLLIVFLVLKSRKSNNQDELLVDDYGEDYEDDLFADEEDEEVEEQGDELEDEELDEDEDTDSLADVLLAGDMDDEQEDEDTEELEEPLVASSFDSDGEESLEPDEFGDLDDFFSDDSSDAKNVVFSDQGDASSDDDANADTSSEESSVDEDLVGEPDSGAPMEYSADDLIEEAEEEAEALFEHDEDNGLEFDAAGTSDQESTAEGSGDEDSEIDLENSFDFTEPGVSDDLDPSAEADFEESLEIHSPDMADLLVPPGEEDYESEEEGDEDSLLDDADEEELEVDMATVLGEDFEGDHEGEELLEPEEIEEPEESSILDVDDDLDLDEGMDADLGDLDLDDDLGDADSDEEFVTKLELAEAYIEMGDLQGARELLSEVEKDGTAEQQEAAKELLSRAGEK